MAYALSMYEMETHITWNAEEKIASIWTCDPVSIRKLDKLVAGSPDVYRCVERGEDYAKYKVDSKFVIFRKPPSEAMLESNRRKCEIMRQKRIEKEQSIREEAND